jgi:serine/threonine-protein kinase
MPRCPHCGDSHGPEIHFCSSTGQPLDLGPRLIGQVLLEGFEVVSFLGEGPVGAVLEVERMEGDRPHRYAAKMLHPRYASDDVGVARFLSEAALAGTTGSPYVASVLATGRDTGGAPLVIREYMEGSSLDAYIEEHAPLPVTLAIRICRQVLEGLEAAHEAGVGNFDLSPGDVFLVEAEDGQVDVKLVDFGEAHLKHALAGEAVARSSPYFAPETGANDADERVDLWATACILYQMLTGKLPFGESPDWKKDRPRPAPPVRQLRQEVDRLLEAVLQKALSLDPSRRYQNAGSFEAALARAVGDRPSLTPPLMAPGSSSRPSIPAPGTRAAAEQAATSVVVTPQAKPQASAPPSAVAPPTTPPPATTPPAATGPKEQPQAPAPAEPAAARKAPEPAATRKAPEPAKPEKAPVAKEVGKPSQPSKQRPAAAPPAVPRKDRTPVGAPSRARAAQEPTLDVPKRSLWLYAGGAVLIILLGVGFLVFRSGSTLATTPDRGSDDEERPTVSEAKISAGDSPRGGDRVPEPLEPTPEAGAAPVAAEAVDSGSSSEAAPAPEPAPVPESGAEPEPVAEPEPALPAKVQLAVRVTPSQARITLDGEPLDGNPYRGEVERSTELHTVRASADGFHTATKRVRFTEDQDIAFELSERPPERPTKVIRPPMPPQRPVKTRPPSGQEGGFHRDNPFD